MKLTIAVGLIAVLGPCAAAAGADIVVLGERHVVGAPGEQVSVSIGCGGCPAAGDELPVVLVPAPSGSREHPCRGTSCAATSFGPPTAPPYLPLGVATPGLRPDVSRLSYLVPNAAPGLYKYVIYCGGCWPGRRGSLVGHPSAHVPVAPAADFYAGNYLRIRPRSPSILDRLAGLLGQLWPTSLLAR